MNQNFEPGIDDFAGRYARQRLATGTAGRF